MKSWHASRPCALAELSLDPENFQGHLSLGTLYLAAETTETAEKGAP